MQLQTYIKSFSSGQITIPRAFRERLSLGKEFWLRLALEENRIIAVPIDQPHPDPSYGRKLLGVKGSWFHLGSWKKMRKEIRVRIGASP
ncbi:AbrB/MazE/SpoVT family DNA-binding domain-containing protein [Candidatus Gottesmanbacteria bacterium]|nr:AbrB/MazE/SpoVT family DNA-binding domain-containing protein [Candidatus Gottesmanbacteria bacterium]